MKVPPGDFLNYFQDLCSRTEKDAYVTSQETQETDPIAIAFPELDKTITSKEIVDAVKSLKNEKSSAYDNIINEMLSADVSTLKPVLNVLFNSIFDSGYYPSIWKLGIIVPIFKKGDKMDPQNYRGITLLSCLAKLFSRILNNRLQRWAEENSVISDAQYGFKKGCSTCTIDALYVLKSIVDFKIANSSKLFCKFVDFRRAFDTVDRNALYYKMFKLGIEGKMLRIIISMYDDVKCCVQNRCVAGDILSPMLF